MQYFIPLLFIVFIVHSGAPALKAISIPFSCFIVTSSKGNDKMMLFHRNAPCFFLRRNLQRKFINRSDEVKVFLGRVDQFFNFPVCCLPFSLSFSPLRNGDRAFASVRKAIRAIPSSKGTKNRFLLGTSTSFYLSPDPADTPHRRRMSRYISFRN